MKTKNKLKVGVRFSLFVTSYFPLFLILIFRQLFIYYSYLNWGGLNLDSFLIFLKYFGAISLFTLMTVIAVIGIIAFLYNIEERTSLNGEVIKITDIENKNNESITYLFTYIIPFVFQDLSEITNVIPIFILLLVTYAIYTNSSLLLINPTLNFKYSLYSIEYTEDNTNKKIMILSKNRILEEGDVIKIKKIGHKLFYSISEE
jgi:hypothetical protein